MSTATEEALQKDLEFCERLFQRVATDLAMIIDSQFQILLVASERADTRPAGKGQIHISFKLVCASEHGQHHGCILVPLSDAITLAACLMMVDEEALEPLRGSETLDRGLKDSMLEVGNFIAGAVDAVTSGYYADGVSIRSEGCQGVRADVRPAFPYQEGTELVLGRAVAKLHGFPEFEMLALLPAPLGGPTQG